MGHKRNIGQKRTFYKQNQKDQRKEYKQHSQEKRARLVIKNLPFKATENAIRELFEQHGPVKEVNLLRRPDGKMVGCGFVQYVAVQGAVKARHYLNGHEMMGRKLECDFAVSKDRYLKKLKQDSAPDGFKEQHGDFDESIVKAEDDVKEEIVDEEDCEKEVKEESDDDEENNNDSEESEDESSDEEDEEDSDENEEEVKEVKEEIREKVMSNDVTEGKTVFVKNIPFEATNDDLKKCMYQFGPIYYALICVDKMTEHSKGTGFVKFTNKEDAEKCLQAGTELKLLDNILDCHPAINKKDMDKQNQDEKMAKKTTDSRNLYLVKEGVILAGSKAAEGVSASDMAKRLQLEQYKTQMLRNLNMYVSRNRLIVHNLPPSWDDAKLRELLKKHAGKKSMIKEAKIMRDMKNVDSQGVGTSKEFGFVTFTTHEHALNALRSLNNNPNVFVSTKRPIVAFSIENRVMVKAKEKRLERSKLRNPLSKQYDPSVKSSKDGDKFNPLNNEAQQSGKRQNGKGLNNGSKQGKGQNNALKPGQNNAGKQGQNNAGKQAQNNAGKQAQNNAGKQVKGQNNVGKPPNQKNGHVNKNNPKHKNGMKQNPGKKPVELIQGEKYTGVEATPGGVNKMRSRYNLKTQAQLHHETLKQAKKKKKNARKNLEERQKEFIKQPKQKQHNKPDTDNFSKMVNDYKRKLTSAIGGNDNVKKAKWFE